MTWNSENRKYVMKNVFKKKTRTAIDLLKRKDRLQNCGGMEQELKKKKLNDMLQKRRNRK